MAKTNSRPADMQYISSTAKGFIVKFFGKLDATGVRPLEAYKSFRISEYGSTAGAREAAQSWRNDQKAVLRRHPSAITSTIEENEAGLIQARWNVVFKGQHRQVSMRKFGYTGAYKRALTALEKFTGEPLAVRPSPPQLSPEQIKMLTTHQIQMGEVMDLPPEGIRLSVRRTTEGFVRAEWLVDELQDDGGTKTRSVSIRKSGFQQAYKLAVEIRKNSTGQTVTGIIPLPDDNEAGLLAEIGVALVIEDKRRRLVM